ncbi:Cytochrome P450, E-class, group I [Parasponia andersonii]|uniref:Cytochrome P450, E-class, group I n=1 Tax=Parasponia andersonii TaxID=3476 RepID=A0A2P5AAL5_PARAD|nr:Cytochrome P450, E-class, group I [Parasponia andersonii]
MAQWVWTVLALVLIQVGYVLWKKSKDNKKKITTKKKKLPPGPKGYPLFGSLNLLGEYPHRDLQKLAQKYGPIMHIRLGLIPTIVVSSPEAAELVLKTYDLVFATRPPHEAAKHISWEQRSLTFAPYGSYWRDIRKMCTLELLSSLKISSFRAMRKEEVGLFIAFAKEAARDRVAVDLSAKISSVSADMSCRMVFGKKYSDDEFNESGFKPIVQEAMHLAATPNFGDYLPFIAPLDLQGLTKRMKVVRKVFDDFLDRIIDEHIQSKDEAESKTKDFVDVMLSFMGSQQSAYCIERQNIKAIILDMLAASMDTSATAIEWAISELIKNPRIMKKVQEELETVVGMDRVVEESDLEKLEYLDMVVKESLRLHPVAPLLLPHAAMEDCVVDGFHVPKNSRVVINIWTIGRDPNVWTEPEKFFPERFVGSSIDIRGRDFQLIPFGSGRRGCPGLQLGLTVVRLVLAQLVHCFDWELPNGMLPSELDMTEEFGLTTPRAKHLLAIPTYRLRN